MLPIGLFLLVYGLWYATVTVYLTIRGGVDIRHMLASLERLKEEAIDEPRADL